jgi:hypothetical protein
VRGRSDSGEASGASGRSVTVLAPVCALDANALLPAFGPEAELGRAEQPSTIMCGRDAVVDELSAASARADSEQRRHLALSDPGWELDVDTGSVVIGAHRPPWRAITFDPVAELKTLDLDARRDRLSRELRPWTRVGERSTDRPGRSS